MHRRSNAATWVGVAVVAVAFGPITQTAAGEQASSPEINETVQNDATHTLSLDLPLSRFLGPEARAALSRQSKELAQLESMCPVKFGSIASAKDIVVYRGCQEKYFYSIAIARLRARYNVTIQPRRIGGVGTEEFTPVDGVPEENRHRVLINLHGGDFMFGARWGGQLESIPIAALGKIRIVSVDYRMAPEHKFPAASEDVASVYKVLLKEYKPESIGIYGCSAGGVLTAESVAWILKEGLPPPGAVGMFCGGAWPNAGGDSEHFAMAFAGGEASASSVTSKALAYFQDQDLMNPLAFPGLAPEVMARFPASLLITSTRDFVMSSVVVTHAQLVRLGVRADLHVWEGVDHAFLYDPELPESREAYDVIARFFHTHLRG